MTSTKSRTIRFPREISERSAALARRKGVSFNEFVVESVLERLQHEEDTELAAAFELLGQHPEISSVDDIHPVARETWNHDNA